MAFPLAEVLPSPPLVINADGKRNRKKKVYINFVALFYPVYFNFLCILHSFLSFFFLLLPSLFHISRNNLFEAQRRYIAETYCQSSSPLASVPPYRRPALHQLTRFWQSVSCHVCRGKVFVRVLAFHRSSLFDTEIRGEGEAVTC